MCGRFALFAPEELIRAQFGVGQVPVMHPRYNIAPSQQVLVIRNSDDQLVADHLRWGLVPFWAKDPAIGNRMINARAETVADKPSFRQALRRRRCLIPANGFFEWQKTPDGKQPWYISSADSELLAFAGLWEEWQSPDDQLLRTCTIITTVANPFMQPMHHRMPVILHQNQHADWLQHESGNAQAEQLLSHAVSSELQAWKVGRKVNNPVHDEEDILSRLNDS